MTFKRRLRHVFLLFLWIAIHDVSSYTVNPSESLAISCCNNGMYHSSIYQECIYDSVDGLDFESSKECERSFLNCCRSYADTRHCAVGISQALNSSFCPYMSWTSPTEKERVSRSCCESCLRGLNDKKENTCKREVTDFSSSRDFNSYQDCCNEKITSMASQLSKHEVEEAASSEIIIDQYRSKLTGSRSLPQSKYSNDRTCQELNHCAHFCIDATLSVPKHCTCRSGYYLGDDGGSCLRTSTKYSSFRSGGGSPQPCIVVPSSSSNAAAVGGEVVTEEEVSRRTHSTKTESVEIHSGQTCKTGFTWDSVHHQCLDVDECASGNNPCFSDQTCINYDGGYYCRPNQVFGSPPSSIPSYRTSSTRTCEPGLVYSPSKGYCVDEDECALGYHNCGANQVCRNTYRNHTCDCIPGYQKNSDGQCLDVNECTDSHYTLCPPYESTCTNTPGSYRCLCRDGFRQTLAGECKDIDECHETPNACGPNSICLNSHGGFRCRCPSGFKQSADGKSCEDIDECSSGLKMCVGLCANTPGSFECTCPSGFKLDSSRRICEDIDECLEGRACHSGEKCLNTMGDKRCYRIDCPSGYYQDPQKENRCVKRLIKQVYDQQRQTVRFEDNEPHYITFNHLTLACNLSDYSRPFYDFSFDATKDDYVFEIEVKDVKAGVGVAPATESSFQVLRSGRNGASIYLTRPLTGPQDVELHFKVLNRDREIFYKAVLNIFVSKYDGVHF